MNLVTKNAVTEPVVEGMRSDCWGAITDTIFLETLFLESCAEHGNEGCEQKDENPTSFCRNRTKTERNYMLNILCHTIETKKKKMKKYCIRGNNWDRSQRGTYEYMEVKIRRDLVDKKRGGRSYSR